MALELKPKCEKCEASTPPDAADVFICSYECTYCGRCSEEMGAICPNCSGELVKRPRRKREFDEPGK